MARRFVFRLQAVLEQREREERDHQLRVAQIEREKLDVESRISGYQRAIIAGREALRAQLGGAKGGPVAIDEVRLQTSSALHLVAKAQRAAVELAGVHARLNEARGKLLKAAAARKAVEMLKDKRYQEWLADERKREAGALDEMTVMRHARTQREGAWT